MYKGPITVTGKRRPRRGDQHGSMRLHPYGCDDDGGSNGRSQSAGCATRLAAGRCVLLKVCLVADRSSGSDNGGIQYAAVIDMRSGGSESLRCARGAPELWK
jgi:hypothetical protein